MSQQTSTTEKTEEKKADPWEILSWKAMLQKAHQDRLEPRDLATMRDRAFQILATHNQAYGKHADPNITKFYVRIQNGHWSDAYSILSNMERWEPLDPRFP